MIPVHTSQYRLRICTFSCFVLFVCLLCFPCSHSTSRPNTLGLGGLSVNLTGRLELCIFFALYLVMLPLQILTMGSLITQGLPALVSLMAMHVGTSPRSFDPSLPTLSSPRMSSLSSLVQLFFSNGDTEQKTFKAFIIFIIVFFIAVIYISLDGAFSVTKVFGPSVPSQALHSIPLFRDVTNGNAVSLSSCFRGGRVSY
jgi:hypothetical protein